MEQIHHIIDWKYVVPSQKWKWQDLKIKLQIQGSIPIPSHIQNQTKRVKEIVSLHAWTVNRCLETEVLGPKVASWIELMISLKKIQKENRPITKWSTMEQRKQKHFSHTHEHECRNRHIPFSKYSTKANPILQIHYSQSDLQKPNKQKRIPFRSKRN